MRRVFAAATLPLLVAAALSGCSAALVKLNPEQTRALEEAQRVADRVTKAYGVPGVRLYASDSPGAGRAAGTYSYRNSWIFLQSRLLTTPRFLVVLSHELGHATLDHRPTDFQISYDQVVKALQTGTDVPLPPRVRADIVRKENEANHRGVEILERFFNLTREQALEEYTTYFIDANESRGGRHFQLPFGQASPCDQLQALWSGFDKTAPPCDVTTTAPKITECPYDDWMSTGCKAGQPLVPSAPKE